MSKIKTLIAGAILFVTAICAAPSLSAQCSSGGYGSAPSSYGYGYSNYPYSGYGYNYPYSSGYGYDSSNVNAPFYYNPPGTSYQNPTYSQEFKNKRYQSQYQYSQQPMPMNQQQMAPQSGMMNR